MEPGLDWNQANLVHRGNITFLFPAAELSHRTATRRCLSIPITAAPLGREQQLYWVSSGAQSSLSAEPGQLLMGVCVTRKQLSIPHFPKHDTGRHIRNLLSFSTKVCNRAAANTIRTSEGFVLACSAQRHEFEFSSCHSCGGTEVVELSLSLSLPGLHQLLRASTAITLRPPPQ